LEWNKLSFWADINPGTKNKIKNIVFLNMHVSYRLWNYIKNQFNFFSTYVEKFQFNSF
jgi:hypothetical protein